jgi:hypothetical protein
MKTKSLPYLLLAIEEAFKEKPIGGLRVLVN